MPLAQVLGEGDVLGQPAVHARHRAAIAAA